MSPPAKHQPKRRVLISRATKERLLNALLTGTSGGYLGSMILPGGKSGMKGARIGASVGALIGATNRGKRSTTADGVATGGDWKFQAAPKVQGRRVVKRRVPASADPERPDLKRLASRPAKYFSAYVEDMTFGQLPDDAQKDVLRFVDAKEKGKRMSGIFVVAKGPSAPTSGPSNPVNPLSLSLFRWISGWLV